ncbi:MAG: hypothetical protein LC808_07295 [Actinobacteria bacterium]|nr:hypothetical protein [Actinomycetota bacterium]
MSLLPCDPRLLDHLTVEFGDHGRRAVEFLLTAQALLELESPRESPRLPETVAYCLREAMKTIPASQDVGGGGLWRSASRAVADSRRRYELVRGVPGEDEQGALDELLATIDDLKIIHSQEGIHERRLIAIMVNRTGALPVASGTAPIRAYQDLLRELDEALHGDTSLDRARQLWNRCAAILRQLFLPPDLRHAELDSLAATEAVTDGDVGRLLPLIAGPNHLRHFLSRIPSPEWLEALTESGILDPPAENGPWPVFAAVDRLAPDHGPALADWLHHLYNRNASDAARAWFVARAAVDVGYDAAPLVLRVLRDHSGVSSIADLGVWAVEKVEAHAELVETFADILLNEASWRSASYVDPVIERLLEGMEGANAARRLQLLCWKLRGLGVDEGSRPWFNYERAGSIAGWTDDGRDDRFTVLLHALVEAVRRSRGWIPVADVLVIVDLLPDDLRGRVRALVLAGSPQVNLSVVVEELSKAIVERDPTGDDLPLLDRVVAHGIPEEYATAWAQALGPAPSVVDVAQQLSAHELAPEWLRAFHWVGVLPEAAIGRWAQPVSVMAAAYGRASRETLERRHRAEVSYGRSPMSSEELASLPAADAAARVAVVKTNTVAWLASPLCIATNLRHPTYIHHYLRGVAEAIKSGSYPPVEETLDLIGLVRAHPWAADRLGRDDFDYDHDWRDAEQAAVDVLKALADKDIGFAGRGDDVWAWLDAEARDREEPSGIISGARDPLDSAINRRCTRALEAVLSFMAHEFRSTGNIRPSAFTLLEDALRLEGSDGAEHRAIIATRLGVLRQVASEWVDKAAGLLFGADAPEDLAQVTADLAIKWSRPNRWLFERYRHLVRNAVSREVDHALDHLLIAMLWDIPGYSVEDNVSFLRQSPPQLSKAGEMLGRLLRHGDADEGHVACGVTFWDAAISTKEPDALPGFGWLAEVENLTDETWASRTMATLAVTGGRIDWSHKVAERAASLAPSTTTLAIMNRLTRGASDEWDRRRNIERAVELLRASDEIAATPEYERLRTTLLERGAL